ncbi:hypothetical protein PSACC_02248 [Paramicrosporidium saccamoebae]|uniref:Sugar phosphate transporter domain-containing protein n=1 Tax=Paramicrosporidium saccamoebae TaxID=1246581 RepID=A0A2H9TJP9_9FUNG|nr:hypothetical protein PSACC_02248 [Paramicrosporidium saccamoebae]
MSSADDHSRAGLWIFFYFAANLLLTLHNKWVLSSLHFNFPWTLTALHISVSGIGSYLLLVFLYRIQPSELDHKAWTKLLLFSALYAANIAISNVSLAYVSLAFHQLIRSATPAFTVLLELVLFRKTRTLRIYCALLPVVLGICMATVDEFSDISFTVTGLCLTLLGVILSCVKGIITNVLMVGPLRLHPLDLIWRMALPSVLQCLVYGSIFGELQALPRFFKAVDVGGTTMNTAVADKLLINGLLALWLNWVSFTANKKTSALTMTVAGNIKQALSVVLAIYIFDSRITSLNFVGVVIALSGGTCYESFREQQRTIRDKSSNDQPHSNLGLNSYSIVRNQSCPFEHLTARRIASKRRMNLVNKETASRGDSRVKKASIIGSKSAFTNPRTSRFSRKITLPSGSKLYILAAIVGRMYPHPTYPESDASRGRVLRLELHSISLLWGGIIIVEPPPNFHVQNAWFVHSIGQVFQDNTIYQTIIILFERLYFLTLASKFRHEIWRLPAAEQDPVVRRGDLGVSQSSGVHQPGEEIYLYSPWSRPHLCCPARRKDSQRLSWRVWHGNVGPTIGQLDFNRIICREWRASSFLTRILRALPCAVMPHTRLLPRFSTYRLCFWSANDGQDVNGMENARETLIVLEDRLDYLIKITARLEILKLSLIEFFSAQKSTATTMTDVNFRSGRNDNGDWKSSYWIPGCCYRLRKPLEAHTLDRFCRYYLGPASPRNLIVDDNIRLMHEIEQAFNVKRMWKAAVYHLEIRIIDTQATLIKSQNDQKRNFDKNYRLSESFLKMREELKETSKIYDTICQRLNSELDRIDSQRMLEIEQGINHLLRNLLDAQTEVLYYNCKLTLDGEHLGQFYGCK